MRKFLIAAAVVAVSGSALMAGPLGNIRKRVEERREARHNHAEIVVGKDGKPLLRWTDGSTSKVGVDKEGKLIAAPKTEAPKVLKQSHGPDIRIVPGAKIN